MRRNVFVMIITFTLASIGLVVSIISLDSKSVNPISQNITGNWMDVHGIGMFPVNKNNNDGSLYLATHNGLFKKDKGNNVTNSGWVENGNDKSDLMGFTLNPTKEGVMYSSGHPQTGGNLGFRISNDYGVTWQQVSNVTTPVPIDFHTITVGNNPQIIYGSSGMGDIIFISSDEGKTWNTISPPSGERVITLTANQSNSAAIYASTTNGLYYSMDKGNNWQKINNELINNTDTMVSGLEISSDGKMAYAFVVPSESEENSKNGYIIKSTDGAKTWSKTDGNIDGAVFISKFAFGQEGEIYATVTQDSKETGVASSVFRSDNEGKNWTIEGTNSKLLAGV